MENKRLEVHTSFNLQNRKFSSLSDTSTNHGQAQNDGEESTQNNASPILNKPS